MFQITKWILIIGILGVSVKCSEKIRDLPIETKLLHVGDDTKLECFVTEENFDNSKTFIHWERPVGKIIANGPVLILKNVQLADSGNYTCRAFQTINSKLVSQEVIEEVVIETSNPNIPQPDIVITEVDKNNEVHLIETQYLMLKCEVKNWNKDKYRIQWMKESTKEYLFANNILFYKSITKAKHEDRYRCEVQHIEDESKIYKAQVDVFIKKPEVTILIMPTEYLHVNGRIHRKCVPFNLSTNTFIENYSFRWINELGETVSHSDMLQIPINDESVSGTYECQYLAKYAGTMYTSKIVISKIFTENSQGKKYDISIVQYPQKTRLNERLSLRCQVLPSLNNVRYEWFRNGKNYQTGQTLIFSKFTKLFVDRYECRAIGTAENNVEIYLTVESDQRLTYLSYNRIELTESPGPNIALRLNEKKELHCEIENFDGFSGKNIEWFFNGKKIENSSIKSYRLDRLNKRLVSILVLLNSQLDNEGRYECRYGIVRKEATVMLDIDSGMIVMNPSEIKVIEGSPVEFHCRINDVHNIDNRNLSFKFYNNNFQINYSLRKSKWRLTESKIADHTSFINLDKVTMADSGYIECIAGNGLIAQSQLIVVEDKHKFNITVTPNNLRVRKNQLFEFECFGQSDEGIPYGEPRFEFPDGKSVENDKRFIVTTVGPSRIRVTAPHGVNIKDELKLICSVNKQVSVVYIQVQETCPPNQRQCRNRQCLPVGKFCDGIVDCVDGSDEDQTVCNSCEPAFTTCQDVRGFAPTRKTINKNWICDGEDDCGNNYDEINCEDKSSKCNGLFFTCNNNMTIPRGQVCDGNSDCLFDEDEADCLKPVIISTSKSHVKAKIGSTVKLQCEATAHPLPTIIWRFNWGCLPNENRVKISTIKKNCRKVISTLTINDFQAGDDAIYNCEALSSSNRALSQDFHVSIQ